MLNLTKAIARRAGPAAVIATGATAAQARVAPSAPQRESATTTVKFEDEWVIPQLNGEHVLFTPYKAEEIDESCAEISALVGSRKYAPSATVSEVGSDTGSVCTQGSGADAVIESSHHSHLSSEGSSGGIASQNDQLPGLLQLASRLLRRPGLQSEVFACMLEDPEVRRLMMMQCDDLNTYMLASGVDSNRLLLPSATVREADADESEGSIDLSKYDGLDLVGRLVNAVSSLLARTGGALACLGGWLRDRFAFLIHPSGDASNDAGSPRVQPGAPPKKKTDVVLGSAMVVVVAVACMLIVRRPMRLRFA